MTATEKLAMIEEGLAKGATVYITTYARATKVTAKVAAKWAATGRPLFKVVGASLFIAAGKRYDCADYCGIVVRMEGR